MKEIALHMLDIAENSLDAGATRIKLGLELTSYGMLEFVVEDNGKGMNENILFRTADPFFTSRTTRRIGMGIPMLRQHAEQTGGNLEVLSKVGYGTRLKATFIADNPDIQPLGDIEGCWWLLAAMHKEIDIILECKTVHDGFIISSKQVLTELNVDDLHETTLKADLKRLIRNNLTAIGLKDRIIENKRDHS